MNGAEGLVRSLVAGGVEVCFTNPGTSEMHIVSALDQLPEMRCVLGLFEGVVTGAADGYARMTGKPACTLLHLGPGLANGLANLHNAARAEVPIINLVGQHPAYHLRYNTPLTTDIEAIARPFSSWVKTSGSALEAGRDAVAAIVAARSEPGGISTLIIPADIAWSEGGAVGGPPVLRQAALPSSEKIDRAAQMLGSNLKTAILLAGSGLLGKGLVSAGRIAAGTGAELLVPYPFRRIERGAGREGIERIPYVHEQAVEFLKEFRQLILVGAPAPVAYFAYPGKSSVLTSAGCQIHELASPGEDCVGALEALESALTLGRTQGVKEKAERPSLPQGEITLAGLAAAVGALLPENAIVADESMTSGRAMMTASRGAPPHDWLANTGGSIGIALPQAVGAAVACPDRPVLCLSADGSSMYTVQALWTMAREGLNVTTVIFANRAYAVLRREFSNLGVGSPGPRARDLFEIGRPGIDWISLAQSMGIPGNRATTLDEFTRLLRHAFDHQGPNLIEVPL